MNNVNTSCTSKEEISSPQSRPRSCWKKLIWYTLNDRYTHQNDKCNSNTLFLLINDDMMSGDFTGLNVVLPKETNRHSHGFSTVCTI